MPNGGVVIYIDKFGVEQSLSYLWLDTPCTAIEAKAIVEMNTGVEFCVCHHHHHQLHLV
jgi:hypothetical protein